MPLVRTGHAQRHIRTSPKCGRWRNEPSWLSVAKNRRHARAKAAMAAQLKWHAGLAGIDQFDVFLSSEYTIATNRSALVPEPPAGSSPPWTLTS